MWRSVLATLGGTPIRVLEIGSYEGRSARWLLDNVKVAKLTCLDTFDDEARNERFAKNVGSECARQGIWCVAIAGPSQKTLSLLYGAHAETPEFDFVYVDGSHEAHDVVTDAVLAFRMLRVGGLMCFDDYIWSPGELDGGPHAPELGVRAFIATHQHMIEVLHVATQVWIRRTS
jgi:predicted O-methyltransferase YrrM